MIALFAFLISGYAQAWEHDIRTDIETAGFFRSINAPGFSIYSSTLDGFVRAGSLVRLRKQGFQFEVKPEILGLVGLSSALPLQDAAHLSVVLPARFLNLSTQIAAGPTGEVYFNLDRADLSFSGTGFEADLGRRPVALGVLKLFPVWNKFSRPPPVVSGPPLIFGSDAADVRVQKGEFALRGLQVLGVSGADHASIGELTWYSPWAEFHFLESYWWREQIAGAAVAFDLGGALFRIESLFIGLSPSDPDRQVQVGAGMEYAFSEQWSAILEGIYQDVGALMTGQYRLTQTSRYLFLQAAGYTFARVEYKPLQLWTFSIGDLLNCVDASNIWVTKVQYSLSENIDVTGETDIPLGRSGGEFSTQAYNFSGGLSIGVPYQASIGIKATF